MLTAAQVAELVRHPDMLDRNSLEELKAVVASCQAFHAARILLLGNLMSLDSDGGSSDMWKCSLNVPSRSVGDIVDDILARRDAEYLAKDRTMSLLNDFLGSEAADGPVVQDMPVSSDYLSAAGIDADNGLTLSDSPTDALLNSLSGTDDDAFLQGLGRQMREDAGEQAVESGSSLKDSYFTETLASIYIRQHRYEEAIEIIRSLSLTFPNKSSYFADQIRYLEKIINSSKQKNK